ncbi:aminotransferase class IV [Saccharomonospora piscinae]|uniref:aminotransferase class IV n=1 Tax=Saccharomonospora piscinae TaxID=687388 RepID=UPI000465D59E|nr:aminotransferase class IV [Saccharomonospora piscinae]
MAQLNGRTATAEQLAAVAVANYGHFTTLRVTEGRTRGLDAHLERLADGNRRVFGTRLDGALVRECLRRAVPGRGTVVARVSLVGAPTVREPDVLVTLRAAPEPGRPMRLRTVHTERALPDLKHVGTFAQHYHARAAREAGFDDALFVTSGGHVAETSVGTVGLLDAGGGVVWPQGPALTGTTGQLLTRALRRRAVPVTHRPVPLAEVGRFTAAFVCNAVTLLRPVTGIDDLVLPGHSDALAPLREAYEAIPEHPL